MYAYVKNVIRNEVKNMASEETGDPQWKQGDLAPMVPVEVTLNKATHSATGQSKFGDWFLWNISVENADVYPKGSKTPIKNYTGEAICFPSKTLQEGFLNATNGTKEGVKVKVTLIPKKNAKGSLYTSFEVEIVEDGKTDENTLQSTHSQFINDFKSFVAGGAVKGEKEDFMGFGKTDAYKIPETTLEKLWNVYNEGN